MATENPTDQGAEQLDVPVVFVIFRRAETTRRVFERIRAARPRQLLVVADGPRTPEEAAACEAARAEIQVDWPCELLTNYAEANMGLKRRVASGLDWAFEQVEQAIILEDDCLPDPTFFRFCAELLDRYRDDERVMHISGVNFLKERVTLDASYYVSRYVHVWGWATWARAWAHYDVEMARWHDAATRREVLAQFEHRHERSYWKWRWKRVAAGLAVTWDSQWSFAVLAGGGLCITPDCNLISNIGAGDEATNTLRRRLTHGMPTTPMTFPLRHVSSLARHAAADDIAVREAILNAPSGNRWLDRARWLAKTIRWQLG